MGYERPEHRRNPEKHRNLGKDVDDRRFTSQAKGLTIPMKLLLLPHNGSFYGAACVYNSDEGRSKGIVYWNNLLHDKKLIIPIDKADDTSLKLGKAYFLINRDGEKIKEIPDLSKKNTARLELLVEQVRKELENIKKTEIRPMSSSLKGIINKTFPDEFINIVNTYFKAVGYKNHTIQLPLNQNH